MTVPPSVTEKRNALHREQIAGVLHSLGQPSDLDTSHVVVSGVDQAIRLLSAMNDPAMMSLFYGPPTDLMQTFQNVVGKFYLSHIEAPGISFRGPTPRLDTVTAKIWFGEQTEKPGYIIPIKREMLKTGEEWNEHVIVVPRQHLNRVLKVFEAMDQFHDSMNRRSKRISVYNGESQDVQPIKLEELILEPVLKQRISSDVTNFMKARERYTARGLPWTRRYLFNGPPGTGKTSIVRWMSTELGLSALSFDFSDPYADGRDFTSFLGWCRRRSPAIVIFDDLEKIFEPGNNATKISPHAMLTAMSGVGNLDGLVFACTSNSTEAFNGPMRRRFDQIIEVGLPGDAERRQYIQRMLDPTDVISKEMFETLVQKSKGWSIDDLRAVFTDALGSSMDAGFIGDPNMLNALARAAERKGSI